MNWDEMACLHDVAVRQPKLFGSPQSFFLLFSRIDRNVTALFFHCPHDFPFSGRVQVVPGFPQ
jgi:hypothetical protein